MEKQNIEQDYFCDLLMDDTKRVDTICIKQDTQEIFIEADKMQEFIDCLNTTRYHPTNQKKVKK